jgi:hypothetical protein
MEQIRRNMLKRNASLAAVLTVVILAAACIHKAGGTVTAKEKAVTYNAVLAETNNTLEKGAEAAAASKLLPVTQAKTIIELTGRVAELHKQVTNILEQGVITDASIASIKALLDQIKTEGDLAIASGALGVKNPNSQNTFTQDLDSLYSAADAILSALSQAKVGQ